LREAEYAGQADRDLKRGGWLVTYWSRRDSLFFAPARFRVLTNRVRPR
jgi:hypothetical protein